METFSQLRESGSVSPPENAPRSHGIHGVPQLSFETACWVISSQRERRRGFIAFVDPLLLPSMQ